MTPMEKQKQEFIRLQICELLAGVDRLRDIITKPCNIGQVMQIEEYREDMQTEYDAIGQLMYDAFNMAEKRPELEVVK